MCVCVHLYLSLHLPLPYSGPFADVWLGIYDQEWLNGSRVARALWAKGNPDGPPQDCGRKYYSVLADAKCSENWYFLCEIK